MATEKSSSSRPAKKSSSPVRESSTNASPTKESTGRQRPPRKSSTSRAAPAKRSAPRAEAPRRSSGGQIAAAAMRQLAELTGKDVEGVTGLERGDDGWKVQVEVVELRRVPDTTDVLALYEVEVDSDGDLQGYRRARRYVRGVPGEE